MTRLPTWVAGSHTQWQLPPSRGAIAFWLFLLMIFLSAGISLAQIDASGLLEHPTPVSWDLLGTAAPCLLCLGQIARRTRFHRAGRLLVYAVLPVLGLLLYLRWTR